MEKIERYPMVMRRGEWPNIESTYVHSAEQEAKAVQDGFSLRAIKQPEPEPEKPVLTIEDRLVELEGKFAELLASLTAPKRGPGRPPKGE